MKEIRHCVICNKEFFADRNRKTCSPECSLSLRRLNGRLSTKRFFERHKNDEEYKNKRKEQMRLYREKKMLREEGEINDY